LTLRKNYCILKSRYMPIRRTPLVTGEIYHILNRGVNSIPIFMRAKDYQQFLETFLYYQYQSPPVKFSHFRTLPVPQRNEISEGLKKERSWKVDIIAFCLMPNHFHFLLRQLIDNGVSNFIRCLNDSYSHFFNTKYQRKGPLFEGRFKSVRVETSDQLVHICRYIHLNPYASFLVGTPDRLADYPYSSFGEYLGKKQDEICRKEIILNQFSDIKAYKKFIFDQADYQRTLDQIKHQQLE